MSVGARPRSALITLLVATGLLSGVGAFAPSDVPDVQLQLGNLLYADGRYREAMTAFQRALGTEEPRVRVPARAGVVRSALRIAEFAIARTEAITLRQERPRDPQIQSVYADAMWSSGLFDEAQTGYRDALALQPDDPRGHNGMARVLSARSRYQDAMDHASTAVRLAPRESDFHHTLGNIHERLGQFEQAARSLENFINLLPKGYTDNRAVWSRAELRFLRSFGKRVPYEMKSNPDMVHVLPFRLEHDKIIVQGHVNGGPAMDFIVDTGAEMSTVSRRTSERQGVDPVTYTISAGVGEMGLRGLQLGRIDKLEFGTLSVKNVPCIIKSPALTDLPTAEGESLSPLAMGLSMAVDYKKRVLTLAHRLPPDGEPADETMGLWMHRLATVRGMVDASHARSFVVDTGGQVISISTATADALERPSTGRKIALKVYGASGWDRDAYLLPGVDVAFNAIHFNKMSVVVLNLRAPSVLLGYDLGGIVGHQFLSRYRVTFDLEKAELRLKKG